MALGKLPTHSSFSFFICTSDVYQQEGCLQHPGRKAGPKVTVTAEPRNLRFAYLKMDSSPEEGLVGASSTHYQLHLGSGLLPKVYALKACSQICGTIGRGGGLFKAIRQQGISSEGIMGICLLPSFFQFHTIIR